VDFWLNSRIIPVTVCDRFLAHNWFPVKRKKTIPAAFGPTISWEYWLYTKRHLRSQWQSPIKIFYGGRDTMTGRETLEAFCVRFHVELTIIENGTRWFHTGEQLSFLRQWEEQNG